MSDTSSRAKGQELFWPKCADQATVRVQASKRGIRNRWWESSVGVGVW